MSRPFDVRVREYRDSLLSQADQLDEIGRLGGKLEMVQDVTTMFRAIAVDLTKLLEGEELGLFVITGEMPAPTFPKRPKIADHIEDMP